MSATTLPTPADAYRQGWSYCIDRRSWEEDPWETECPFKPFTKLAHAWLAGYYDCNYGSYSALPCPDPATLGFPDTV